MKMFALLFLFAPAAYAAAAETTPPDEKTAAQCAIADRPENFAGCVKPIQAVADGYQQAHEDLLCWMQSESDRVQEVFDREKKLKDQIKENGVKVTELKFEKSRANRRTIKELARENKRLWKDLKRVGKEKRAACRTLSRGLDQQTKQTARDIAARVKKAKQALP